MRVQIDVSGTEHEPSSELKRVLASALLPVACHAGAASRLGIIAAKQMQQVGFPKPNSAVSTALLVDEERELDTGFLPENTRIVPISQPYDSQVRSFVFELVLVFTQLRDVLPAKNSTIVAKKDEHGRPPFPQRAESDFAPIGIRQHDVRQRLAQRSAHSIHQYTEAYNHCTE
jgi:hypothetical protein